MTSEERDALTAEERDAQVEVLTCEINELYGHLHKAESERDALLAITPEDVSDES